MRTFLRTSGSLFVFAVLGPVTVLPASVMAEPPAQNAPQGRTTEQMLQAVDAMVKNAANAAGARMWTLIDAVQKNQNLTALLGSNTEVGGKASAKIDQYAAEGKAQVDQIVDNILKQLRGPDVPKSLVESLQRIKAAGEAAVASNARDAKVALMRALVPKATISAPSPAKPAPAKPAPAPTANRK